MKKLFLFLSLLIASISFSQAQQFFCPIVFFSLDRTITNDSVVNITITIDSIQSPYPTAGYNILQLAITPLGETNYTEQTISGLDSSSATFQFNNIGSFVVCPVLKAYEGGSWIPAYPYCNQFDTFTYPVPYVYPVDTVPVDTIPTDTTHTSIQEINNYNTKIYYFNNDLYINSYDYLITNYQIINMLGQIVDDKNVMLSGVNKIQTNISEGNYVVICTLSNGNKISKHINIINK